MPLPERSKSRSFTKTDNGNGGSSSSAGAKAKSMPRTLFVCVVILAAVMSNLTFSAFTSTKKSKFIYNTENLDNGRQLRGGKDGGAGSSTTSVPGVTKAPQHTIPPIMTFDRYSVKSPKMTPLPAPTAPPKQKAIHINDIRKQRQRQRQAKAPKPAPQGEPDDTNIHVELNKDAPYHHFKQGAFIHLGKTGGSTLAGFIRHGCHSFMPHPCEHHPITGTVNETQASLKTRHYYHVPDFLMLPFHPVRDFYIVTLRDPYERTRSSFVYSHPANDAILGLNDRGWARLMSQKQYSGNMETLTKCFPTLEQFVQNIGNGNEVQQYKYPYNEKKLMVLYQKNCTNFARAAMNHRVKPIGHLFWNLEHISELMGNAWGKTVIFATRQEHMKQDWQSLNKLLGETKDTTQLWPEGKKRDVSQVKLPVPNELSEEGRVQLCRALRGEYMKYVEYLHASVNLAPEDVEESLELARKNCGDQLDFLNGKDTVGTVLKEQALKAKAEGVMQRKQIAAAAVDDTNSDAADMEPSPVNENAAYAHLKKGAFIHVSDTGGKTLAQFLRHGCHSLMPKPCKGRLHMRNETIVSRKTKQYYHIPDFPSLPPPKGSTDFYVVTLRDPLERTRAAFVHGHPANEKDLGINDPNWGTMLNRKIYKQNMPKLTRCFDTLENFVEHLGDGNDARKYDYPHDTTKLNIFQKNCTNFARAALDSRVKVMGHLFWNLEHLYELMEEDWSANATTIFATRQEHLKLDWASTNELLGETMDTTANWPATAKNGDDADVPLPVPNKLSESGRIQLCRALRGEYKRYLQLLQASVNLSPQDVDESLTQARNNCGDQLEFLKQSASIAMLPDDEQNIPPPEPAAATKATATTTSEINTKAKYASLKNGAFIHLGKTGGSTLAGFLRHGCHQFLPHPCPWHSIMNTPNETVASVKTRWYFHVPDFPNLPQAPVYEYYIVTLRDPYERTRSGFVYSHPANDGVLGLRDRDWKYMLRTYHKGNLTTLTKCFPSLEEFVGHIGDGNEVKNYRYPLSPMVNRLNQKDCRNFARAAMNHHVRPIGHLFWNLENIYEMMSKAWGKTVIFATRQEQIVQDWESLNHMLGETKDTTKFWPEKKTRDVSKLVLPVPNELSEEGRVNLCRALRGEYERYVEFLKASVNLTPKDVEESLARSRKNCGDQLDFL